MVQKWLLCWAQWLTLLLLLLDDVCAKCINTVVGGFSSYNLAACLWSETADGLGAGCGCLAILLLTATTAVC